jgi:integrase
MPLKLVPPREGRSKNWRIRGTWLRVYVDESAGSPDKKIAQKKLQQIRAGIERGEFSGRGEPTFLSAAVAYIDAGGEARFIGRFDEGTGKWSGLVAHFGETPLSRIDQAAIDAAAAKLYPEASPATRNRQVHTPISAILKHAGADRPLRRPKGSRGKQRTDWLWPEQAFRIFKAARQVDAEFAIFLKTLCYTGMRLSDACFLEIDRTRIAESFAYLPTTKNEDPRGVFLPAEVVAALATHPRGLDRPGETVFRFRKNGRLYQLMKLTLEKAGADLAWVTFHVFCHTWATWMRRYGGLDTKGLVGTGRWRDEASARRYQHVVASEESRRAALLPTEPRRRRIRAKSVELK